MIRRYTKAVSFAGLVTFLCAGAACASTILFTGENAAIFPSANPADQGLIMESVSRGNNPATASTGELNPASLIEQSVESQISSQIYNEIFNTSNPSGSYSLGNGNQINFLRTGGNLEITITDPANGTTTITLPDL